MIKNSTLLKIALILGLVLLGVAGRMLPHPWNFTPLSAIALVTSAYLGWRYSMVAVMGIMLLSDFLIGFYDWPIMLSVYGSLILAVGLGTLIERRKASTIVSCSLASSLLFFFITNWAVWQFGTMYVHSFSGLIESYTMALPFFRNSLMGDLLYTGTLFGIFEIYLFVKQRSTVNSLETQIFH